VASRPGLGPRIDPSYDAEVGRILAQLQSGQSRKSTASGYIELLGETRPAFGRRTPYDELKALFAVVWGLPRRAYRLFGRLGRGERPHVWTTITRLRYLTTDPGAGVALPLYSFNPEDRRRRGRLGSGRLLDQQLERLERLTEGRLAGAGVIGVTVDFDFTVEAERLLRALARGVEKGPIDARTREEIDSTLFGRWRPLLKRGGGPIRFDTQDLAVSGGIRAQLKNAIRELRDGDRYSTEPAPSVDYAVSQTGKGVIVGVVDFGCDFAHPSFCSADRRQSRILALWDQNDCPETDLGNPMVVHDTPTALIGNERLAFGFGRLFGKAKIDDVLAQWRQQHAQDRNWPYRALGYDPHHHHYQSEPPPTAHGTGVLDIAVGRERSSPADGRDSPTVRGVAPEADIVFVQVRTLAQKDGRRTLDANDVVDAVAYIFHLADELERPCVVNLSLNTMSGPHDGDGHFERRLADLMRSGGAGADIKGRAVVVAAGNLPETGAQWRQWQHIADTVTPGKPFEFVWNLHYADRDKTRNTVEIWYDARDAWLRVTLTHAAAGLEATAAPGHVAEIFRGPDQIGSVIGSRVRPQILDNPEVRNRMPATLPEGDHVEGRHAILLSLDPHPAGVAYWKVSLSMVDAANDPVDAPGPAPIPFHAWLERDDEGQTGIARREARPPAIGEADRASNIGTLSCGCEPIVVAAYDASHPVVELCEQSASGPVRAGPSKKPDLSAPGVDIWVATSKSDTGRMMLSGTSLAAPFVSGTIACLYQIEPDAALATIKDALRHSARHGGPAGTGTEWSEKLGWGRLNPRKAVDWLAQRPPGPGSP
jgi:subtilisin family serine protease